MRRAASLALLACSALASLTACGTEAPYVQTSYRLNQTGFVMVCSSGDEAARKQADALAEQTCARYRRTAKLWRVTQGQCDWLSSTQASYICVPKPGVTPMPFNSKHAPLRHDSVPTDIDGVVTPY